MVEIHLLFQILPMVHHLQEEMAVLVEDIQTVIKNQVLAIYRQDKTAKVLLEVPMVLLELEEEMVVL